MTAPGGDTITAQFTPTNDQVFDGISGTMTQIVTQRYITLTAAAWDKIYDGSTSATGAVPTVTGGSLAVNPVTGDNDTLDYTESFTSRNAISSGFLSNPLIINSATGSVSDGNGGKSANYSVTYLNSTAGAILPLAITVTANAVTKVYDGGTSVATATSGNETPTITEAGFAPAPRRQPGRQSRPRRPGHGQLHRDLRQPGGGHGLDDHPLRLGQRRQRRPELQRELRRQLQRRHHADGHPFRGHDAN